MVLHLDSFEKAIKSLEEAIAFSQSDLAKSNERLLIQFRNSVIQCFAYTYELSWKMLKRRLELDASTPKEVDEWGFNDLMREAAIRGYINDPVIWMEYRKKRNVTSHAYDEKLAQEVYLVAIAFLTDAQSLLQVLKDRNQ